MMFVDTHAHLDYKYDYDLNEIIKKAKDNNVNKIITISAEPDSLDKVVNISANYKNIYGSVGIHPHYADKYDEIIARKIIDFSKNEKIVAIGEIGLDYYYNHSDKIIQKKVFEEQINIAVKQNLPIVVHIREAEHEAYEILSPFFSSIKNILLHSYTGDLHILKKFLDNGCFVGFNGMLTFKKSDNIRSLAEYVPLSQIVLETDSPYLAPIPYRGKKNYIPVIAEKLAEIKKESLESLSEIILSNSLKIFNIT